MDQIKEMFYTMDTDKTGDLTFEELKHGLHKYGQPVADPEVQMLMDAVSFLINPVFVISLYFFVLPRFLSHANSRVVLCRTSNDLD